ncbi:MAG TPA: hypothetical protein VKB77_01240 [Terriglobales bacterium]|nr:hypothetical protein [Terriglobales bacterium]
MTGFEQAAIKVEKKKEFEELQAAIGRVFAPQKIEGFLKRVESSGIRIRDWDAILTKRVLEGHDQVLARSGASAEALYRRLSLSDQAQMREFFLSRIEEVDEALRHKFKRLYQYY